MEMSVVVMTVRRESFRLTADAFGRRRNRGAGQEAPVVHVRRLDAAAAVTVGTQGKVPVATPAEEGCARGRRMGTVVAESAGRVGDGSHVELPRDRMAAVAQVDRGSLADVAGGEGMRVPGVLGSLTTQPTREWRPERQAPGSRPYGGHWPAAGLAPRPAPPTETEESVSTALGEASTGGGSAGGRWPVQVRGVPRYTPIAADWTARRRVPEEDLERMMARLVRRERLELAR